MNHLLVVDWDYFFPVQPTGDLWYLYDWSHSEAFGPALQMALWSARAEGFLWNDLPLPRTDGTWDGWWSRFTFDDDATLYVADSNVYAYNPEVRSTVNGEVWLYDAHHDSGYRPMDEILKANQLSCEDWMVGYWLRDADASLLHVRYPTWRTKAFDEEKTTAIALLDRAFDDGTTPPVTFSKVMLCRSGSWTPPWVDQDFLAFAAQAPIARVVELEPTTVRDFPTEDELRKVAAAHREVLEQTTRRDAAP